MDLLLFSNGPSASLQAQLTQGLPLKAVYCDSLVGFRYLYPRPTPPGSLPVNLLAHAKPPLLTWTGARRIVVSRWTLQPLKLRLNLSSSSPLFALAPQLIGSPKQIVADPNPR